MVTYFMLLFDYFSSFSAVDGVGSKPLRSTTCVGFCLGTDRPVFSIN